jgi:hypothetical protein
MDETQLLRRMVRAYNNALRHKAYEEIATLIACSDDEEARAIVNRLDAEILVKVPRRLEEFWTLLESKGWDVESLLCLIAESL